MLCLTFLRWEDDVCTHQVSRTSLFAPWAPRTQLRPPLGTKWCWAELGCDFWGDRHRAQLSLHLAPVLFVSWWQNKGPCWSSWWRQRGTGGSRQRGCSRRGVTGPLPWHRCRTGCPSWDITSVLGWALGTLLLFHRPALTFTWRKFAALSGPLLARLRVELICSLPQPPAASKDKPPDPFPNFRALPMTPGNRWIGNTTVAEEKREMVLQWWWIQCLRDARLCAEGFTHVISFPTLQLQKVDTLTDPFPR